MRFSNILGLCIAFFVSCSKTSSESDINLLQKMPAFVPEQHISANEFYLSEADAVTVASIFKYDYRSKAGSLSEESCNIKSVVHIESDGDTI